METKEKLYESPQTVTVDLKMENSLLTGSPDYSMNPGNPFSGSPDEENW